MTKDILDALQALAEKATQGEGQHIYTDQRDDNNWLANEAWHRACSPAAVSNLIARIRELEGRLPCSPEQAIAAWNRRADTGKSAEAQLWTGVAYFCQCSFNGSPPLCTHEGTCEAFKASLAAPEGGKEGGE